MRIIPSANLIFALLLAPMNVWAQTQTLDGLFKRFGPSTPGCVVGVDRPGQAPIKLAFGSADLEHAIPNTVNTVFEVGSVSKQITAAAILTLVEEGKLSLEDDVHKYLPALPKYSKPITIDELLTHTSGLRDWQELELIAGWDYGARYYNMQDVFDIAARQKSLNFEPGTNFRYTNTGFNLLALVVEKVSGKSLEDFTRERFFGPLGMSHTQWRVDYRQIVPNRAVAYDPSPSGFKQDMPFQDVYGNGGILTTIDDLLIWNRALTKGALGKFVTAKLQAVGQLENGDKLQYARGVYVRRYRGFQEIAHGGATAGYRAWLGRYPEQGLSIALLCNESSVNELILARAVADNYLPASAKPVAHALANPFDMKSLVGLYADDRTGMPMTIVANGDNLRTDDGQNFGVSSDGQLMLGLSLASLPKDGTIQLLVAGVPTTFTRVASYAPDPKSLEEIVGTYKSEELGSVFTISLRNSALWIEVNGWTSTRDMLKPLYTDAFIYGPYGGKVVRLIRGTNGAVVGIKFSSGRAWAIEAARVN